MMTRYIDGSSIDGTGTCLQRIHVTGGTSGILVDSLRKYRPFTPVFIGRAEDQSFLLSVLFDKLDGDYIRYVHKDGLIMRHDKEAFAAESIMAAREGKIIGDYIRILLFSYYTDALPWPMEEIKNEIDPFTGCFVSKIPFTVAFLRFALKAADIFLNEKDKRKGYEFFIMGIERLSKIFEYLSSGENPIVKQYMYERDGWNLYYDILSEVEKKITSGDDFAERLLARARSIVDNCCLRV